MLKALVFDFDGVIVDTESEWYYIYRDWLQEKHAYDLHIKDYLVCVGSNSEGLFSFLEKELGKDIGIRDFETQIMQTFMDRTSSLPAMEGVVSLMKEAKQKGLKIAIATSATRKKPMYHLERLQLMEYVDALSTAELSQHIKPAPDIFIKAAQLLQVSCEECLAIEDSANGLLAARRANMPCVIVPNEVTKGSDFTKYYRLVSSLSELNLDEIIKEFHQG